MSDAHKNFAYSTVLTAPSPADSGTSLVVASGDGTKFPSVPFNATVWPAGAQPTTANAEIVRVTNIATDTFTITRTQESTSARTIVVGDQIAATVTAKTLTDAEITVATDTIWDAAGDLALGSGADTAARLAKGTPGQSLIPDGTTLAWTTIGTQPTAVPFESYSRLVSQSDLAIVSSQRLSMQAIWLPKGLVIASISFMSNATALATGVNQLFGLYDDSSGTSSGTPRALLRGSNDDTSTAWAANTLKTLTLTSTYTTTRAGQFYLGILVNATTMPTLVSQNLSSAAVAALVPISYGTSNTGVTSLPNPANALSAAGRSVYCGVNI